MVALVVFIISSTGTAEQVYVFLHEIGREKQPFPMSTSRRC